MTILLRHSSTYAGTSDVWPSSSEATMKNEKTRKKIVEEMRAEQARYDEQLGS
jgi:hypothetical protein